MNRIIAMFTMVIMMMGFSVQSLFAAGGPVTPIVTPSAADLKRMEYELAALQEVTTLQVDLYDQEGKRECGGVSSFLNGEASLQMDVKSGPGNYRGYASWNDKLGNQLFYSYDYKLTTFWPGLNAKDFPMFLDPNRMVRFQIEGVGNNEEVWINGNRAWFNEGYWHTQINQPWLLDAIGIVWTGHGGWNVAVSPSFKFGGVVSLVQANINPSQDSVSQMVAVSYAGDDSWMQYGSVGSYMYQIYDSEQDCYALQIATIIPNGTKVMAFLSYWDDGLKITVEYSTSALESKDGFIFIPLKRGVWFDQNQSSIRLVFPDKDGKIRQACPAIGGLG
jgi:hypothetical protein